MTHYSLITVFMPHFRDLSKEQSSFNLNQYDSSLDKTVHRLFSVEKNCILFFLR